MAELQYVVPKLGARLLGVEIGNELNLYNDSNVETECHSYPQAIHTNVAGTAVAGPGVFEAVNSHTGNTVTVLVPAASAVLIAVR